MLKNFSSYFSSSSNSDVIGLGVEASSMPGPPVIDWDTPLQQAKEKALSKK